jgi:hypothetical protein
VNRGFYCETRNPSFGRLAYLLCALVETERPGDPGKVLGADFAARILDPDVKDADRLNVMHGASCYRTRFFSHALFDPLLKNAEDIVHVDSDEGTTLLVLNQSKDTPPQNQAHWYDESTDSMVPIAGGLVCAFNGRAHYHGLISPTIVSPKFPWDGATVVMKSKGKGRGK